MAVKAKQLWRLTGSYTQGMSPQPPREVMFVATSYSDACENGPDILIESLPDGAREPVVQKLEKLGRVWV
jgi:hypothetical protein